MTLKNRPFIGRTEESHSIEEITQKTPCILAIHGRRRVGKTRLIEQVLRDRHLIKIEGIEGATPADQRQNALDQLSAALGAPELARYSIRHWRDFFELVSQKIGERSVTLYLEEVQWLANYRKDFASELKHAWDNHLSKNSKLLLVLCGSSPSFIVGKVLQSRALYNRSQYELHVRPFSPLEVREYLGPRKSLREVMEAVLTVGGIPEYLQYLKEESSVYLSLCSHSFKRDAFFLNEYEKVFVSNLSANPAYKKVIQHLSKNQSATRNELALAVGQATGGTLTDILTDLERCDFIATQNIWTPRGFIEKNSHYFLSDPYVHFFNAFIRSKHKLIREGRYQASPTTALDRARYEQFLGYSLERFCRHNPHRIAKLLGFSGVEYKVGTYVSKEPGQACQIDLVFERSDRVCTLCEIKFTASETDASVVRAMQKKREAFPNPRKYSLQTALITAAGASQSIRDSGEFDHILSLEELFRE